MRSTCGELSVGPGALMGCLCADCFTRHSELPEANQRVSFQRDLLCKVLFSGLFGYVYEYNIMKGGYTAKRAIT